MTNSATTEPPSVQHRWALTNHTRFTYRPVPQDGFLLDLRSGTIVHIDEAGTAILMRHLDAPHGPSEGDAALRFFARLAERGWVIATTV